MIVPGRKNTLYRLSKVPDHFLIEINNVFFLLPTLFSYHTILPINTKPGRKL